MANKYASMPHGDMGSGIDALSAEDSIGEGYSEDLLNCDPTPEGYLSKRPGYQGKFGYLPVRVISLDYALGSTNNLTLRLDTSIDLSNMGSQTGSRPIVVSGRTSTANTFDVGDFTQEGITSHYYPSFTADTRKTFSSGTNTLTVGPAESALTSPLMFVGTASSSSTTDQSNYVFNPSDISITQATSSIAVTDVNGGSAFSGFIYWLPQTPVAGEVYVSGNIAQPVGITTTTITVGTHGLSTPNIQVKAYVNNGTTYSLIEADSVTIATNEDVTIVLTNATSSSFNVVFILSNAPIANTAQGIVLSNTTLSVQLPALQTPFLFATCYLETSIGGPRVEVIPDSITVDALAAEATVTFTNDMATTANFFIYWQTATLASNHLTLTASAVGNAFTDTAPQLTIWGLDHAAIYSANAAARAGWVSHLDTYRAQGEGFLVSGLGGNLFSGKPADIADASTYLIPQNLYPSLRARVSGQSIVGPTFLSTLDTPQRTRGSISGDNLGGFATAGSMTYDSGSGYVQVVIPITNMTVHGTLGTIITTTSGLEDKLTVQSAAYSVHNGIWPIKSAVAGVNTLTLLVSNSSVTNADYDDLNSGAQVGIFTDRMTLDRTSPYIPGDVLVADVLTDLAQVTAYGSSGTTVLIQGLDDLVTFLTGLRIAGTRTSSVIPLRLIDETRSVVNLVSGDNLALTGFAREFRVKSINILSDINVTITGNSSTELATVTLGSADTSSLFSGDVLLLTQAGVFTGEVTIASILSTSQFTFTSTLADAGVSGILFGKTAQVDESFTWSDSVNSLVSASVPGRWIPFEAPDTTANEAPNTHVRYLTESAYDNQPILRSTQVNDTLILDNGIDRSLKVDGANVYRPGLIRWQTQLFLTQSTTPGGSDPNPGKIVLSSLHCSTLPVGSTIHTPPWVLGGSAFYVDVSVINTFQVGDRIQVTSTGATGTTYTIQSITTENNASNVSYGVISVDSQIQEPTLTVAATFGTLTQTSTYSYYFRLNAVDANQNIIASAVTGASNFSLRVSADAQIRLRLVGLPVLDTLDYDRLEVQIYRTKANGVAPYYLLTTLPLSFDKNRGYIDYVDTASDEELATLDPVNTALKGQELGTGWSPPIRAARVTSAAKRLVLGNLTADPTLDLRLLSIGNGVPATSLIGSKYTLRKDSNSIPSVTNMIDTINFEFVGDSLVKSITGIAVGSGIFTVNTVAHGLASGDWVYLFRKSLTSTNIQTHFMGWWQVFSVGDANHYTVQWPNVPASITFADEMEYQVAATNPLDVPVFLGLDQNYQFTSGNRGGNPPTASDPYESLAVLRFANAVNTTQRIVNRNLAAFSTFTPWIVADAGGEFAVGELILRQPNSSPTTFSLQMPSAITGYNIYANQVLRAASANVSALTQLLPSRILASYPNFAEIFDSPLISVDSQSDSAVDVNPDDGQSITAVVPFFGASAFGAALKDAVVVVFKQNSIYIVNLAAKAAGQNPIQRIESQGLGCTAPNSVTPVRDGIMFANESGMYKLKTDMSIYYMGRRMQRLWREGVNLDALDLVFGHNYSFGSLYKLSVPVSASTTPNQVFVYNSIREYSLQGITNNIQLYQGREGSWTRQDSVESIGWANLNADSYYAGLKGRVFILRRTGLIQDFRDDDQAISMSATLRAMDFGDEGVRKTVPYAMVTYRNPLNEGDRTSTQVAYSTDLADQFTPADLTTIPNRGEPTGMGDVAGQKAISYRYSFNQKRGVRFQLAIVNSGKDEPVEITRIRYDVAGLSVKGIREAATPQAAAVTK